jgi:type IV secretion system protein VirD4
MMLDEFPALGRLDFFETSLAFMAGYGIRAFLIAQSLNQIEKAYGEHNAILDNCHVRVAFATNDERTAKRLSDALGTATEQRAMRNYAGHRLAPWLAHVMVSRQETARQLLTPGEVMQLPQRDELVLISGLAPIRATKLRYFLDPNFTERLLAAPEQKPGLYVDRPPLRANDWAGQIRGTDVRLHPVEEEESTGEDGGVEQAQQPGLPQQPVRESAAADPREAELQTDDENAPADKQAMDQAQSLTASRSYGFDESNPHTQVLGL